jgi:hypothetical protein
MTLFEYLAIAYSLVLSFAAIRLVAGLPHAIDSGRRYWVHLVYVCGGIFAALALFWAHWSTRDVDWTFPGFLLNLAGPGTVYFLSCTIIPDEPSAVRSWRAYFFSVRHKYFGGLCVWAVIMVVNTTIFLNAPLVHPSRAMQAGLLVLGVAGLATNSPKYHALLLIWSGIVVLLAVAALLRPGSLDA